MDVLIVLVFRLIAFICVWFYLLARAVLRWFGIPGTADPMSPAPRVGWVRGGLRLASASLALAGVAAVTPDRRAEKRDTAPTEEVNEAPTTKPAPTVLTLPAVGTTFAVDISDVNSVLRDFPSREVADQVRDWALLGTLNKLGLSSDAVTRSTAGMAPIRFPYLEEMLPFEYGRGRRAIVETANGAAVLLFYEASEADPRVTLGRLADRVRMELGELPEQFEVFRVEPQLSSATIRVQREAPLARARLLSAEYGYYEALVHNQPDFEAWLSRVDDVVWARDAGDAVAFAGRRFANTRERGVTLEDVVVLYRAQVGAKEQERTLERQKDAVIANYERKLRSGILSQEAAQAGADAEMTKLAMEYGNSEPGFSLDPHWRLEELLPAIDALAADFCKGVSQLREESTRLLKSPERRGQSLLSTSMGSLNETIQGLQGTHLYNRACTMAQDQYQQELRNISAAVRAALQEPEATTRLRRGDEAAAALEALGQSRTGSDQSVTSWLARPVGRLLRARFQVQCARYDGPAIAGRSLQGTRVGMNLFYTDLLAKLWVSLDYRRSAPSLAVAGFLTQPLIDLEPEWLAETEALPSTRLWFGPKRESSTRATDGSWISFRHVATRVFSAGSNPLDPKSEAQPGEASRRSFGWWDRHYEDVAVYEPEYALQNQIMKWSVLAEWLVSRNGARFLDDADVEATPEYQFDSWHADNKTGLDLRYQHPIELRPRGEWLAGTECMDLLVSRSFESASASWTVSGGVSLAGSRAAASAPRLAAAESPSLRFLNAIRAGASEPGVGTSIKVPIQYAGHARVLAKGTEAARMRWRALELDIGHTIEARATARLDGTVTQLGAPGKGELGWFGTARRGDDVVLRWSPAELHTRNAAQALGKAPRASKLASDDPDLLSKLARESSGDVQRAAKLFQQRKSEALSDASQALAEGDIAGAAQRFRAAHSASAEHTLQRALVQLEAGAIDRGRGTLLGLGAEGMTPADSPLIKVLNKLGVSESDVGSALKSKQVAVPHGSVELFPEPGRAVPMLRVERPLSGRSVSIGERQKLLEKFASAEDEMHDFRVYLADEFSLNQQDMKVVGEGVLADFAQEPQVKWSETDALMPDYAPERLIVEGVRYQLMSAPRRARAAESRGAIRRYIFVQPRPVQRCDPELDPTCTRAAPQPTAK